MPTTLQMALKEAEANGYRIAHWDACSKMHADKWPEDSCFRNIATRAFCEEFHGPHLITEMICKPYMDMQLNHQYTFKQDRIWCTWYDGSRSEIIYSLRR